ncbi:MAG TPA: hypothetical protein VFZ61_27310, partial [Polyangiales bacterium]
LCALAVLFHGVAVWSVFGLVALAFMTKPARPGVLSRGLIIVTNGALGLGVLGLGFALFYYYLTPGVTPVHVTPLVHGGPSLPVATSFGELASVRPVGDHALAVLRIGFPALVALLAAALALPRQTLALWSGRDVRFALIWLSGFALHQLLWRSTLGTYRDWDLFGFTAIPLAYLAARAHLLLPRARAIDALLLAIATLAGLSWPLAQTGVALTPADRTPMVWEP